MADDSGKWIKLLKTAMLTYAWFAMGFKVSLIAATLPDLRTRFGTTTAGLSYAMSIGQIGGMVGSLLTSFLDRFGRHFDLIIASLLCVIAASTAVRVSSTYLWLFTLCDFIEEMCWICVTGGGSSAMLDMWGSESGPYLQTLQLGYPIGATFGPLVAAFFVSRNDTGHYNSTDANQLQSLHTFDDLGMKVLVGQYDADIFGDVYIDSNDRYPDDSSIEYAFYISSLLTITAALPFIFFYFFSTKATARHVEKGSHSWKDIFSPSEWSEGLPALGVGMLLLMMAFFICHNNQYNCISVYITTYAVDSDLGFTNNEAALLSSVLSFVGSISRFCAIFISNVVAVEYLFGVHVNGSLLAVLLLTVFGPRSKTNLYVFVALYGFVFRPLRGYNYSFVNLYMIMIAIVFGLNAFVSNLASVFLQSLHGYLYDNTVIEVIFYLASAYGVAYTLVWCAMVLLGRHYGTREERGRVKTEQQSVDCIVESVSAVTVDVITEKENYACVDSECTQL